MNTTVNVLCYKSKILANGEHPLMIRVCKDGKKKYKSLGVSVLPQYWDFTKEKPKRNCPNREYLENIIQTHLEKYRKQAFELQIADKEFSAQSLIATSRLNVKKKTSSLRFSLSK